MAKDVVRRNLNLKLTILMGVILALVVGAFYAATVVARDRINEIYAVQIPTLENAAIILLLLEKKEARLNQMVFERNSAFLDEYSQQKESFMETVGYLGGTSHLEAAELVELARHPIWQMEAKVLESIRQNRWGEAKRVLSSPDFSEQQIGFKEKIQRISERMSLQREAFLKKQDRDVLTTSVALVIVSVILLGLLILIISNSNKLAEQRDAVQQKLEFERARMVNNAKLASLGEMACGISHEINNPLAIIQGNGELIRYFVQSAPDDKREEIARLAKGICDTSKRISKIILGLRRLSTGDTQEEPIEEKKVSEILDDSLVVFSEKVKGMGVGLKMDIDPSLALRVRPHEIGQVVINLMNNAVDALDGVSEGNAKNIEVTAERKGDRALISVADTGTGIPSAVQERMFDPFYTTKEVGKGTGLGLSISKQIVRDYGGDLICNSKPGYTVFQINLPAAS